MEADPRKPTTQKRAEEKKILKERGGLAYVGGERGAHSREAVGTLTTPVGRLHWVGGRARQNSTGQRRGKGEVRGGSLAG